jgi:hypothetical protein
MVRHTLLRSCLPIILMIGASYSSTVEAQARRPADPGGRVARPAVPRPAPRLPAVHPPRTTGTVVFIGGYFYDPFFGPYPWWPRTAYPYWYVPRYDLRAQVRVRATPHEAAVYVDGFYAGLVEDFDGIFERLPLTPGGHDITLYLAGHATARWRLYLQPGSDVTVRATLAPLPAGTPSEPPPTAPPVPAPPDGTYALPRVPAPASTRSAPVVAGFGTLVLHVAPAGAAVRLDGDECLSSSPGYYEAHVGTGVHRIEVTLPGHQPYAREVQVEEGKTATINVTLPPT